MAERDDQFWANFFGIEAASLSEPGVSVTAHRGLAGYPGLWSFKHHSRCVVSAPADWVERLRSSVELASADRLTEPAFWQALLADDCARIIGPAYQGCLEPGHFRPVDCADVSMADDDASATLASFRQAFDPDAWADGGLENAQSFVACRKAGRVVAMCGYRRWSDDAGDPCVLVHPQFRRRGYGSAVVSAVVARALANGKTLLYQTLESNTGAIGIATQLGYTQYARHLAIRLR
jgi:GNAT superfamily N-acetyltransferase